MASSRDLGSPGLRENDRVVRRAEGNVRRLLKTDHRPDPMFNFLYRIKADPFY
jgi:hypothetical protein